MWDAAKDKVGIGNHEALFVMLSLNFKCKPKDLKQGVNNIT